MNSSSQQPGALIAQGRTAEVYAWGEGQILKLYLSWCPANWAEYEARVARAIAQAGIPCPAVGEIVDVRGRCGILYERISGVSMLKDMSLHPWLLLKHARNLASLQAQFASVKVPELVSYREALGRAIGRAPHLTEALREKALARLETLPDGQTLCHGDFHPDNVIISPSGPVVIDWMTAVSGSPWADVARSSMILRIGVKAAGKQQVSPLLKLASGLFHATYLGHFRSLKPDVGGELERWGPVIAAARLDERIELEREALLQEVEAGLAD